MTELDQFLEIDMRIGRVTDVQEFPEVLALDPERGVVLLRPDREATPGARIG